MREWVGTQNGTTQRRRSRRLRRVVGTAAVALACSVAGPVLAPGTASAAPVNPSDQQLQQAEQDKAGAAQRVDQIRAQLAGLQSAADSAHQQALIALQDYQDKQDAAQAAQQQADAAAAASAQAAGQLQQGREDVAAFARSSYIEGTTSPGTLSLLSAGGPAQLLERAALLEAAGDHRTDVVAQLTVLQTQASAADHTAQQALGEAKALQTQAAGLLQSAQQQEVSARAQADGLAQQQTQLQGELDAAARTLYGLQGARAAAQQWAAQQAAAAAARPTTSRSTAAAATASSTSPAASSRAVAPAGSSSAPAPSSASSGSTRSGTTTSGKTTSGNTTSVSPPPAPAAGGQAGAPSASKAQQAIAAARSQIGVLYSWGGGGSNGPSYGIPPDTGVWGFDCSGLTQYAYAKAGIAIGGTSRDQWWLNRTKQVDADDLQPGDLLFYASGSSYTSIYHVALYIGGNQVIEAPDRGLKVRTHSVYFGSDYFGAVRPSA